jgi:DNA-binding transcriptional MerR regulator
MQLGLCAYRPVVRPAPAAMGRRNPPSRGSYRDGGVFADGYRAHKARRGHEPGAVISSIRDAGRCSRLRSDAIMADLPSESRHLDVGEDELVAIPRLAEQVGVTPRVLRYWEEEGLISPTREHGKLRYSPRDVAIARLTKRLLDGGASVDALRMLKELSEREIRRAGEAAVEPLLSELALRLLYQRKAFREVAGMGEEHYPVGDPKSRGDGPDPPPRPGPRGDKKHKKRKKDKKGPRPPGPQGREIEIEA